MNPLPSLSDPAPAVLLRTRLSQDCILREQEPLAKKTTLRVGGPADLYLEPVTETDLAEALRFCARQRMPFFVLGRGSNVLVRDGGFRGLVIRLNQSEFSRIEFSGTSVYCGAGAKLKDLAVEARRSGVAGFEFLEGIPGTMGGALRMNAGAMGSQTFDLVKKVRVMTLDGAVEQMPPHKLEVSYRNCRGLRRGIALGATLEGRHGSEVEIQNTMAEFSKKRWATQPAAPSAGCMFKNTLTIPAGMLIDQLGLKGTQIGGAGISEKHGNFFVNNGNATAQDILALIEKAREAARRLRDVGLETEVQIIGEDLAG